MRRDVAPQRVSSGAAIDVVIGGDDQQLEAYDMDSMATQDARSQIQDRRS